MQKKYYLIYAGILVVFVLSVVYYFVQKQKSEMINANPIACTLEAKVCPDGSAVGRIGNNCEFETCPTLPKGIEYLINYDGSNISDIGKIQSFATNDEQFMELLKDIVSQSMGSECIVTIKGNYCLSGKDLGGLKVNWTDKIVFAVSLGTRSNSGYSMKITGYDLVDSNIIIKVSEILPGVGCMNSQNLTNPIIIGTIDISEFSGSWKSVLYKFEQVESKSCQ